jgi:hypothetical protein
VHTEFYPEDMNLEKANLSKESIGNVTLIVSPSLNFWTIEHGADRIPNKFYWCL